MKLRIIVYLKTNEIQAILDILRTCAKVKTIRTIVRGLNYKNYKNIINNEIFS